MPSKNNYFWFDNGLFFTNIILLFVYILKPTPLPIGIVNVIVMIMLMRSSKNIKGEY